MAVYPPVSRAHCGLDHYVHGYSIDSNSIINTIKIEDGVDNVTWSDPEADAPGDGNNDIGFVSHDTLLNRDSQEVPAKDTYVDNSCDQHTDLFIFVSSTGFEEEDPTTQVMLKSIQDPELAPIYNGLPDLGYVLSCCVWSAPLHVLLN